MWRDNEDRIWGDDACFLVGNKKPCSVEWVTYLSWIQGWYWVERWNSTLNWSTAQMCLNCRLVSLSYTLIFLFWERFVCSKKLYRTDCLLFFYFKTWSANPSSVIDKWNMAIDDEIFFVRRKKKKIFFHVSFVCHAWKSLYGIFLIYKNWASQIDRVKNKKTMVCVKNNFMRHESLSKYFFYSK